MLRACGFMRLGVKVVAQGSASGTQCATMAQTLQAWVKLSKPSFKKLLPCDSSRIPPNGPPLKKNTSQEKKNKEKKSQEKKSQAGPTHPKICQPSPHPAQDHLQAQGQAVVPAMVVGMLVRVLTTRLLRSPESRPELKDAQKQD